jgi:hypothetical protein
MHWTANRFPYTSKFKTYWLGGLCSLILKTNITGILSTTLTRNLPLAIGCKALRDGEARSQHGSRTVQKLDVIEIIGREEAIPSA